MQGATRRHCCGGSRARNGVAMRILRGTGYVASSKPERLGVGPTSALGMANSASHEAMCERRVGNGPLSCRLRPYLPRRAGCETSARLGELSKGTFSYGQRQILDEAIMLRRFRDRSVRLVAHVVCVTFIALPAIAGVEVVAQRCKVSGAPGASCTLYEIDISGPIDEKTVRAFERAAEDSRLSGERSNIGPRPPRVILNSLGGSVAAAMGLGEAIRKRGFSTWVNGQDECSSACVLVLASGVRRSPFGTIAIHRPHFDDALFARLPEEQARAKYKQMRMGCTTTLLGWEWTRGCTPQC
jgi:hypothetical protein